ncbi:MAG: acyltransferase family protein, partial [Terracidiphilus sp.]|nr:acyltransferase family protein [Terracidiphilus sp.]
LAFAPYVFYYHSEIDVPWIIGSFLFVQIAPHVGPVEPVIGLGWSLDFEMFFYAIFALALLLARRSAVLFIGATFGMLIAIGLLFPARPPWLTVWTGPLLVEFLAGVVLAIAYRRGLPIFSSRMGRFAIVLGAVLFAMTVWSTPPWKGWLQALEWGIPATLVVWGTLSLQLRPSWRVSLGKLLGDASYSIYLFQVFALPGLALALKTVLRGHTIPVDLAACILACLAVAVSVGCWYMLERPMTRFLNAALLKHESASAAVSNGSNSAT